MAATYPFSGLSDAFVPSAESASSAAADSAVRHQKSTLFVRFALFNLLALSLLTVAWWEGLVAKVMTADQTHLTTLIGVVFVAGFCISAWRARQINQEIDQLRLQVAQSAATSDRALSKNTSHTNALRLRLTHRIASIRHIANVLVMLGLIGTVLGFIIALSGVDQETASTIDGIAPMVSNLIQGMSTALYTTLVGSILNVWLTANYQVLASGTVELMSLWMEREDRSVRLRSTTSDA